MPSNGLSDEKESKQRCSFSAHFLSRVFSRPLGAEKKLRVENAIDTLFYRPISFGVRHGGIQLKGTKFSNYLSVSVSHSPSMPDAVIFQFCLF